MCEFSSGQMTISKNPKQRFNPIDQPTQDGCVWVTVWVIFVTKPIFPPALNVITFIFILGKLSWEQSLHILNTSFDKSVPTKVYQAHNWECCLVGMFLEQCNCKLVCFSGSGRQMVETFTDCHVYYTLAIGRYWLLLAAVPAL